MENKNVGLLILGIAIVLFIFVIIFTITLRDAARLDCERIHGNPCPMYDTITKQTYLALSLVIIIAIIGLFIMFNKPNEKVVIKKIKDREVKKKIDLSGFREDEKQVLELIRENGTIFQADIIDKTGFGKAKVSRILDRLEGKGIIERKRRGMTNVVVLKD